MLANSPSYLPQTLERNSDFPHHSAIVGTVAESESRPSLPRCSSAVERVAHNHHVAGSSPAIATNPAEENTTDNEMTWTPRASRKDVMRMVSRFVALEFSIRSGAARLVIDESRTKQKRTIVSLAELEDLSAAETLDAIKTGMIRRAVWARPDDPSPTAIDLDGKPYRMRRVAPLRDVAPIVRPKSKMGGGAPRMDARLWRATVAQKLHSIPRDEEQSLLEAEYVRHDLQETRNLLTAARRAVRRLRSSGKCPKNQRRHAETREGELRSKESMLADRLRRIVRTRAYRCGIDNLLAVCTVSAEVEAYCFGSE